MYVGMYVCMYVYIGTWYACMQIYYKYVSFIGNKLAYAIFYRWLISITTTEKQQQVRKIKIIF